MPEFHNDQSREAHFAGLRREYDEKLQHLENAKAAGEGKATLDALEVSLHSSKVEFKRLGLDVPSDDEVKAKVAEKRPAKPAAETR